MTDRIIDLAEHPARLKVRYDNLVVERDGMPDATVPLKELAVLVISQPQVSLTHPVLSGMMREGGVVIVCDDQHLPAGMMLPINTHVVQTRRMAAQAAASLPTNKRLWQQIVKAKIKSQARVLKEFRGSDAGLIELASEVRSGDPTNVEAQASVRYWPLLFNDGDFRRRRDADDQNKLLNYGYTVMRAAVARAICAAGLHPSIGLHHHNQYNAFCLADDLLEPLRALVDRTVVRLVASRGRDAPLDRESRGELLGMLAIRVVQDGEERTLFDLLTRMAVSLAQIYTGETDRLLIPEV